MSLSQLFTSTHLFSFFPELLPVSMPEAHAMLSLVADSLASSLLAELGQGSTSLLQDHVDFVVREQRPV